MQGGTDRFAGISINPRKEVGVRSGTPKNVRNKKLQYVVLSEKSLNCISGLCAVSDPLLSLLSVNLYC